MNKVLSTTLVVVAILALAGGLFFFGATVGRNVAFGPAGIFGYGRNGPFVPGTMMGRGNYGMMDRGGRGGYGMMGPRGFIDNQANLAPLSTEQARAAAQKYIAATNITDLAIADVMIFSNNAYVAVKETSTGTGAFELLVDPASQVAYPEYGPNMMWNLKYGGLNHSSMMGGYGGGMMGPRGSQGAYGWNSDPSQGVTAPLTVSPQQAVQSAQKYLDANLAGAVAASDPMQFYGYYTLDFSRDGKITGMLSVNGYTGQVFLHTWHGSFIQEAN